jgi:hypothetical protein
MPGDRFLALIRHELFHPPADGYFKPGGNSEGEQ